MWRVPHENTLWRGPSGPSKDSKHRRTPLPSSGGTDRCPPTVHTRKHLRRLPPRIAPPQQHMFQVTQSPCGGPSTSSSAVRPTRQNGRNSKIAPNTTHQKPPRLALKNHSNTGPAGNGGGLPCFTYASRSFTNRASQHHPWDNGKGWGVPPPLAGVCARILEEGPDARASKDNKTVGVSCVKQHQVRYVNVEKKERGRFRAPHVRTCPKPIDVPSSWRPPKQKNWNAAHAGNSVWDKPSPTTLSADAAQDAQKTTCQITHGHFY